MTSDFDNDAFFAPDVVGGGGATVVDVVVVGSLFFELEQAPRPRISGTTATREIRRTTLFTKASFDFGAA